MTEQRIPFGPAQETGWEMLSGAGQVAMNVTIDGKGAVRRRPGIEQYYQPGEFLTQIPTGAVGGSFTGLHQTTDGVLFGTTDEGGPATQRIWRITPQQPFSLTQRLLGSDRPTFAETQSLLVIAAGDRLQKISLEGFATDRLGGSPPASTHVAAMASRLVVREITNTDLRNNFDYSAPQAGAGIAGYETWNGVGGSGTFPANARPDAIVALHENTNELFAFGQSNLQTFSPDPQTIWAPVSTREFGCGAPYSVIRDDQSFAWLDDQRRLVHSDGRTFNILSDPIKQTLDDMDVVSDCFGYRVHHGATDALVWTFPTDGRTFVYQRGGGWSQWSGWNQGWRTFPVTAHTRGLVSNSNTVATNDGRVGIMRSSAATDFGEVINAYCTTGFLDHGTQNRKTTKRVRLVLRRGQGGPLSPAGFLSWRDDLGPWGRALPVSLGSTNDRETVVTFHSLGVYRQRQWRFEFAGEQDLVLASAMEEFEVNE